MTPPLFTKLLDAARAAGATDVEVTARGDQVTIKHRVMGALLFTKTGLQARDIAKER